MGTYKMHIVCRAFVKMSAANSISKSLQNVGVYADILNVNNAAKLVFIADDISKVAQVLSKHEVRSFEYVDPNIIDYTDSNRDAAWVKVDL